MEQENSFRMKTFMFYMLLQLFKENLTIPVHW